MFIIVLGGGIDLYGNLPDFVYQRLDKAVELYHQLTNQLRSTTNRQKNTKIVLSGKYSFLYNQLGKAPPVTEAKAMAQYLKEKGFSDEQILIENQSQDTISNAYYLKKEIFLPYQQKEAYIISSRFHLERVRYIFNKVFGSGYRLKFVGVREQLAPAEEQKIIAHQKQLLAKTKKILEPMADGNHSFLDGKFYTIDYYRQKRPDWVVRFATQGK